MVSAETIDQIKKIIAEIIGRMSIRADIETREQPGALVFNIRTSDSNMLIGQYGVNLAALQYVARVLVRRHVSDQVEFVLDVDDYKRKRESFLNNLAQTVYRVVVKENVAVAVKPLPAYERRVVHSALAEKGDVKSESWGDEPNRLVVVRPIDLEVKVSPERLRFEEGEEYKRLN